MARSKHDKDVTDAIVEISKHFFCDAHDHECFVNGSGKHEAYMKSSIAAHAKLLVSPWKAWLASTNRSFSDQWDSRRHSQGCSRKTEAS